MRWLLPTLLLSLWVCGCPDRTSVPGEDVGHDVPLDQLGGDIQPDADGPEIVPDLPPPDIEALLKEARYWLANGEPNMALALFEEALEVSPDDPDIIFGAGLSQFIFAAETLAMVTNLPGQFLGYAAGDGIRDPESMNESVALQVAELFSDLNQRFVDAEAYLSRVDSPEFQWQIDRAPLYYVTRPMLVLRGRFDAGDVSLIRAVNGLCRWVTALLGAQDFLTDYSYVMVLAQKFQGKELSVISVLESAAYLLRTSPRFLALREGDGQRLFQESSEVMTAVGNHILDAVAWLEAEEASDDDVTRLDWDQGERVLVLHNQVKLEGYEGIEEPLRIRLTQGVLDSTATQLAALETPGAVVPFSQGPGIQLSTILGVAAKLGIVEQMGINLPVDITHLEIDQIHVLLSGFLPDVLSFDWAEFHQHPVGLRILLPMLTPPDDPDSWLLSWECPDDLSHDGFPSGTGGLLCNKDAELVDSAHFQGTDYELPANQHLTNLPYLIWEDPTLQGLVLVDSEWGTDEASSLETPDNALLNTGLHQWLQGIMGLF